MSAFCMTKSAAVWDIFRTIDMDVQLDAISHETIMLGPEEQLFGRG